MEVTVSLEKWKVVEQEGVRKIAGTYVVKAGAAEVAKQDFNEGYNCSKVLFTSDLQAKVEKLTADIAAELTRNFTGGN